MPQIIKTGGGIFSKGELLRINPSNNTNKPDKRYD